MLDTCNIHALFSLIWVLKLCITCSELKQMYPEVMIMLRYYLCWMPLVDRSCNLLFPAKTFKWKSLLWCNWDFWISVIILKQYRWISFVSCASCLHLGIYEISAWIVVHQALFLLDCLWWNFTNKIWETNKNSICIHDYAPGCNQFTVWRCCIMRFDCTFTGSSGHRSDITTRLVLVVLLFYVCYLIGCCINSRRVA